MLSSITAIPPFSTRQLGKGPFLRDALRKALPGHEGPVKTWARSSTITPDLVGHTFFVHNGKDFVSVTATKEMVGHRLGEYAGRVKHTSHSSSDARRGVKAAK